MAVVPDRDFEAPGRLPRLEIQGGVREDVIDPCACVPSGCGHRDRHGVGARIRERNGERQLGIRLDQGRRSPVQIGEGERVIVQQPVVKLQGAERGGGGIGESDFHGMLRLVAAVLEDENVNVLFRLSRLEGERALCRRKS